MKIIVDSKGRIPLNSNVINNSSASQVILATTSGINEENEKILLEKGVTIIKTDGIRGQVDLTVLMDKLYVREIDSVLLEGGGTLNASALEAGIVTN